MKRLILLFAFLGLLGLVAFANPVTADEHETPLPPHPHMLLQKATVVFGAEGPQVSYKRCVDLAANQAVPLHAHHEKVHFGTTGVSFMGGESGHIVIPTAPFPGVPWGNCAGFALFFPPG